MIIDTAQTKIELDIDFANLQEQLRQTPGNPNIRFGCSCGKNICYGHAPKPRNWVASQSLPKFKISDFNTDHLEEFIAKHAEQIAQRMVVEPIRCGGLEYATVGRRCFLINDLPQGALAR